MIKSSRAPGSSTMCGRSSHSWDCHETPALDAMQEILYADDPLLARPRRRSPSTRIEWPGWNKTIMPKSDRTCRAGRRAPSETVKVTYPTPQRAVLEVELKSPGLVVLSDVYYPGWMLTIDDKPATIYRVNRMMRGASVPSGAHRLVYTYCAPIVSWSAESSRSSGWSRWR